MSARAESLAGYSTSDEAVGGERTREAGGGSPWGHRIMFVVLTVMAFVLYAPAVVLPVLREHALVLVEERALRADVQRQTAEIENARKLIDAFRGDPLVNERLAQIDLKYQREGEEIVQVPLVDLGVPTTTGPAAATILDRDLELVPTNWPRWSREAESWARERGLVRLYLMPGVRVVLLLMSAGLLVAAFVLYPPKGAAGRRA